MGNRCGFPNKNMMNLAHPSSTGSASKAAKLILHTVAIFFISGYDPLGVASDARINIFSRWKVFYLITNHSKQTCIFGYPLYAFTFFFFAKFCQPHPHTKKKKKKKKKKS